MKAAFRLLFPSWAFFDQPGHTAQIEIRLKTSEPWLPWPQKINRRWYHLFLNPQGNWVLLTQQLSMQLLIESQTLNTNSSIASLESFQQLKFQLQNSVTHTLNASQFEFRLIALDWDCKKFDVIFQSPIIVINNREVK